MPNMPALFLTVRRIAKGLFGSYKLNGKRYAGRVEFAPGVEPVIYRSFDAEVEQGEKSTLVKKIIKVL